MRGLLLVACLTIFGCAGQDTRTVYVFAAQTGGAAGNPGTAGSAGASGGRDAMPSADSGHPDAQPDSAVIDSGAADVVSDAMVDATVGDAGDAGWTPPDGAVSNAQWGLQCNPTSDSCSNPYPSWVETSGRYYALTCHLSGGGGLNPICTFSCETQVGVMNIQRLSDCAALGGACVQASEPGAPYTYCSPK